MRWRGVLAGLAAVVLSAGQARAADDVAVNQRDFEAAARAAASGQLDVAIVGFEVLAARTDAPRVRLELARTLFQAGQYGRAKAEFLKVYHRRDLPYPVRRSINLFLDEIDQRQGFLQPRLGLSLDSNPTQTARSGVYEVLGAPMAFEGAAKSSMGLSYRLDALKPLGGEETPIRRALQASVDGVVFEDSRADRRSYTLAIQRRRLNPDTRVSLGWRRSESASLTSDAPFIEYFRRVTPSRDRQISVDLTVEANRFDIRPDLDGGTARALVQYVRDLRSNTSGSLGLSGSASTIEDALWPRVSAGVQLGLARSIPTLNTNIVASVSTGYAQFGASDVFFGKLRRDSSQQLEVAAYNAAPIFGLFPGLVLSYEHHTSSIPFYGFDRGGVSVDLRRRF